MNYPFVKPKYYLSLVRDLFTFIWNPYGSPKIEKTVKQKTYDTIGLFVIKICFYLIVGALLELVYKPNNLTSVSMSERFGPLLLLLVGGIILPAVEEIAFRLSLKFKPVYLALTAGVFTYYILTKAVFKTRLSMIDDTFCYRVSFSVLLIVITYMIVRSEKIKTVLSQFWIHNFRLIYYLSCVGFAWIHMFNFELNMTNLLLLPILTLPQLFTATIAGYTRIAFGFRYPLFLHMANNLLVFALSVIPE